MSFGARVPVDMGDGVPRERARIICDGCGATDNGGGLCPPDWTRIGGSGAAILHFCPTCSRPVGAMLRGLADVARPMGQNSREPEGGAAHENPSDHDSLPLKQRVTALKADNASLMRALQVAQAQRDQLEEYALACKSGLDALEKEMSAKRAGGAA